MGDCYVRSNHPTSRIGVGNTNRFIITETPKRRKASPGNNLPGLTRQVSFIKIRNESYQSHTAHY